MTDKPRRTLLWLGTLLAVGCKLDNRRAIDIVAPDELFPMDEEPKGEFLETESGLSYRVITHGNQRRRPKLTSTVTVHYRGWLDDGTVVDQSKKPVTFKVSKVVKGWTEALQMMSEGEVMELIIPPHLAYGERGNPPRVPPNATLHFRLELLEIR
jgi:FKBP-type peptidyl-prolyl cis-trans isomerase